jgi:hypothetical protein
MDWDDDRICKHQDSGHITLTCLDHPNLRWNTKNLGGYIGARTIYYALGYYDYYDPKVYHSPSVTEPECSCKANKLVPLCSECLAPGGAWSKQLWD